MAIPRRNIIDPSKPVICHCISRCVRRLPLLEEQSEPEGSGGADGTVGADGSAAAKRDPDRWKKLLGDRLVLLVTLFAIDVLEWAILGNHFHLVLATHPDLVALWSDRELAVRWRTLTPDYHWRRRNEIAYDLPAQEEEIEAMLDDPDAIAAARRALADISTFHKFLKQRIAQLANAERGPSGHFWEGRFKSVVAADLDAVIAHMVYVALNPVRAGLARTIEDSDFSSVKDRVAELTRRIRAGEFAGEVAAAKAKLHAIQLVPALPCDPGADVKRMETFPSGRPNPWKGGRVPPVVEGLTLSAFLNEVDRVGRTERREKASIALGVPPVLAGLESELERAARVTPVASSRHEPPADVTSATNAATSASASTLLAAASAFAAPLEEAMSRGLANVFGNFSGALAAVATRAAELGRMAVWTIFDPDGAEPRRWVAAKRNE